MLRKFKFFLLGLIPGLIFVIIVLNQKGASCSGYLPNSRVIAETLSKKFQYSDTFQQEMNANKIDEKFLRDSILTKGEVDFDRSHAQKKPCPDYVITYPKKNPKYEISFQKCKENATFSSLKKLK